MKNERDATPPSKAGDQEETTSRNNIPSVNKNISFENFEDEYVAIVGECTKCKRLNAKIESMQQVAYGIITDKCDQCARSQFGEDRKGCSSKECPLYPFRTGENLELAGV